MSSNAPMRVSNVSNTLARSRLGTTSVVMFVLAAAAPLTVTAGGATAGFAITASTAIPVAYLAIAVILALFAVGYVAMSRRISNAGAFYTYVAHGLGKPMGVATAMIAVAAYNFMQIGLYGGFGAVLSSYLHDRFGVSVTWWACALIAWVVVAVLGVLRVDLNGRVLAVMLLAEVGIAVLFAIVMLAHPADGQVTFTTLSPTALISAGIGAALVTAVTGFVGFEATVVFSEETRNPRKTVARATFIALATIGLLYGLFSWALTAATGPDRIVAAAQEHSTDLVFVLVAPHVGQLLVDVGHMLFITSLFAALLSFHHTVGRYLFALGREHVLPTVLGRTSRRTGAPKAGSIAQSMLALAVLVMYAATGLDPIVHLFFWITVTGGLGVLTLMTLTSIAVPVFFARNGRRESIWRSTIAPALASLALLTVLWFTLEQFDILLGVAANNPWRWILPATFAAAGIAGLVWALLLRMLRPDTYEAIGFGANAATATTITSQATPGLATAGRP